MTFRSPQVPPAFLVPGLPLLVLLKWRWAGRLLRRLAGNYILQDSIHLKSDPTDWHQYELNWLGNHVRFKLDDEIILETLVSPTGRLVLWIDNQYAAFRPDGEVAFGSLACNDLGWLDIMDIQIEV